MKTDTVPPRMQDRYTLRCKEVKVAPSNSSGTNQISLTCEIVDPQTKVFDGEEYDLTSFDVMYYLPLEGDRHSKTNEAARRLGLDEPTPDNAKSLFEGLVFDAIVNSAERKLTKPDPANKGKYIPITDAKGAPIKLGWEVKANMDEILYPSTADIGRSF